jgi:hypothetical protein
MAGQQILGYRIGFRERRYRPAVIAVDVAVDNNGLFPPDRCRCYCANEASSAAALRTRGARA